MGFCVLYSCVTVHSGVGMHSKIKQRSSLALYLLPDEVMEDDMVRDDVVLFHIHEAVD